MYRKNVPFKDYNDKPRNMEVQFQLEIPQVFKNIVALNAIFSWRDSLQGQDRDLTYDEMQEFFDNFEQILLEGYGKISADGLRFERGDRYDFAESKLFAAFMEMILSDIGELGKILEQIMPAGMDEMVRKQAASLERMQSEVGQGEPPSAELQAKIDELKRLQANIDEAKATDN